MHVLLAHGAKAKRVSYSTSHAETLSMVGGLETSALVMVRLAELLHPEPSPTLQQLTKIQEEGDPRLPVDYYGDCKDVFELLTGQRTLPQDKSQRLYILSLKEARLTGKMRLLTLVPTECMTSDSLTKPMVHESMLLLLTTGIVRFFNVEKRPLTSRLLPTLEDYDEHDIIKSDSEIMKDIETENKKAKIGHSMVLLGLLALCEKRAAKMMLASTMVAATQAAYVSDYPLEIQQGSKKEESFFMVYLLMFFTVIMAILVERLGRFGMNYIIVKMGYQEVKPEQVTQFVPVGVEDEGPSPMDVDYSQLDYDDMQRPTEATIRAMNKKIRQLTEEKDELSVTIHVRQDVIDRLEEQLEEKKKESASWEQFAHDQSDAIDKLKDDKRFANNEEQHAKERCAKLQEEIDELGEKSWRHRRT